jgi:hypothetical protein
MGVLLSAFVAHDTTTYSSCSFIQKCLLGCCSLNKERSFVIVTLAEDW